MADATKDLQVRKFDPSIKRAEIKAAEAKVYYGALLNVASGDTEVSHAGDDSGSRFYGVAAQRGDAGDTIDIYTDGVYGPYTHSDGSLTIANEGDYVCCGADDSTVQSRGSSTNSVVVGKIHKVRSATTVDIKLSGGGSDDADDLRDDLAKTTDGNGGDLVGIYDAGSLITAENVTDALQEIFAKKPLAYATAGLTIAEVTGGGTPSSGKYTIDASGTFSAITAVIGWRITTAAGTPANCASPSLGPIISGTNLEFTWLKEDAATAADDTTVVFGITCIGTAV
jgi:hypothetical protein